MIGEATYGSDKDGLVCAYLFLPGQAAAVVGADEAAGWLRRAHSYEEEDGFLWLHFAVANISSERWMLQHLMLPDGYIDSLHETTTATRVEQSDDALLAVVHDVTYESAEADAEAGTVSLFVGPRLMVSARWTPLRSVDRLRVAVKAGERFRSPADLLAHLLRDQADVLSDLVRLAARKVDTLEDLMLARRSAGRRGDLGALRRMLVRIQRQLAPEPAAMFRLLSRPPAWLNDSDLADLRQSAEELSAAASDAAALVERVRLLQEETAAQISEQTSRILFLLTVVTVLALPFNVIGGLFGMNVGGVPFAQHRYGFWLVVLIVAGFTFAVSAIAWRNRDR